MRYYTYAGDKIAIIIHSTTSCYWNYAKDYDGPCLTSFTCRMLSVPHDTDDAVF